MITFCAAAGVTLPTTVVGLVRNRLILMGRGEQVFGNVVVRPIFEDET